MLIRTSKHPKCLPFPLTIRIALESIPIRTRDWQSIHPWNLPKCHFWKREEGFNSAGNLRAFGCHDKFAPSPDSSSRFKTDPAIPGDHSSFCYTISIARSDLGRAEASGDPRQPACATELAQFGLQDRTSQLGRIRTLGQRSQRVLPTHLYRTA